MNNAFVQLALTENKFKTNHLEPLIVWVAIIGFIGIDMYIPAFPEIAEFFSTSSVMVQATLVSYLASVAISQLIYGPLSDAYGRKKILIISLIIALGGAILVWQSQSIFQMILGRAIQGAGLGGALSLTRSIFRDLYAGQMLAKVGARFGLILGVIFILSPIFGAYIQYLWEWRTIFLIQIIYIIISILFVIKSLPETNRFIDKSAFHLNKIFKNYFNLVKHPEFVGYAFAGSFAMAGLVANKTISPFLFQEALGLTYLQYGWLTALIAISMMFGRIVNLVMVRYLTISQTLFIGLGIMFLGSFSMWIFSLIFPLSILLIIIPMMIYVLGSGLVFTNAMTGSLTPFETLAGTASALYSVLNMLGPSVGSSIAAAVSFDTQLGLSQLLVVLSILSVGIFYYSILRK